MSKARPPDRASRRAAGAVPGSIIAAIIGTHTDRKERSDPSRVSTPMSMPCMRWIVRAHAAAPSPTVAVSATAVPRLALIIIGVVVDGVLIAVSFPSRFRSGLCFCVGCFGEPLYGVEPPVPPAGQFGHGPGGLVEPGRFYPVQDFAALLAAADQPGFLEYHQVLRHRLAGERDLIGQRAG